MKVLEDIKNSLSIAIKLALLGFCLSLFLPMCGLDMGEVQKIKDLPVFQIPKMSDNKGKKYPALIRLHIEDLTVKDRTGRFFCSGFVVSDVYAVTAAHCISHQFTNILSDDNIVILDKYWNRTKIKAIPAGINPAL